MGVSSLNRQKSSTRPKEDFSSPQHQFFQAFQNFCNTASWKMKSLVFAFALLLVLSVVAEKVSEKAENEVTKEETVKDVTLADSKETEGKDIKKEASEEKEALKEEKESSSIEEKKTPAEETKAPAAEEKEADGEEEEEPSLDEEIDDEIFEEEEPETS